MATGTVDYRVVVANAHEKVKELQEESVAFAISQAKLKRSTVNHWKEHDQKKQYLLDEIRKMLAEALGEDVPSSVSRPPPTPTREQLKKWEVVPFGRHKGKIYAGWSAGRKWCITKRDFKALEKLFDEYMAPMLHDFKHQKLDLDGRGLPRCGVFGDQQWGDKDQLKPPEVYVPYPTPILDKNPSAVLGEEVVYCDPAEGGKRDSSRTALVVDETTVIDKPLHDRISGVVDEVLKAGRNKKLKEAAKEKLMRLCLFAFFPVRYYLFNVHPAPLKAMDTWNRKREEALRKYLKWAFQVRGAHLLVDSELDPMMKQLHTLGLEKASARAASMLLVKVNASPGFEEDLKYQTVKFCCDKFRIALTTTLKDHRHEEEEEEEAGESTNPSPSHTTPAAPVRPVLRKQLASRQGGNFDDD
jgi:hypothetical protein